MPASLSALFLWVLLLSVYGIFDIIELAPGPDRVRIAVFYRSFLSFCMSFSRSIIRRAVLSVALSPVFLNVDTPVP